MSTSAGFAALLVMVGFVLGIAVPLERKMPASILCITVSAIDLPVVRTSFTMSPQIELERRGCGSRLSSLDMIAGFCFHVFQSSAYTVLWCQLRSHGG
jgi:hypothetical protein